MTRPSSDFVERAVVDVFKLRIELTYRPASLTLRPACDRPIEPQVAARTRAREPRVAITTRHSAPQNHTGPKPPVKPGRFRPTSSQSVVALQTDCAVRGLDHPGWVRQGPNMTRNCGVLILTVLITADPGVGKAQVNFTDVTDLSGLSHARYSDGAAAGDYDGDGWTDLFLTRLKASDILLRNRGDGTFEDVSAEAGLIVDRSTNGAVWADIDNDGDLDLYLTVLSDMRCYLYVNDGTGRFCEEAVPRGTAIETGVAHTMYSVAAGDFDNDGWVDLHTDEWRVAPDAPSHSRLLRNRGPSAPGYFEDVTDAAGVSLGSPDAAVVFAFASRFADLDNDGWVDLAIAADFGTSRLFWNNRDGTFTDGTRAAGVGTDEHGMGSAIGDYDADGDLDWFVTSIWSPEEACTDAPDCIEGATGNRLYRNEGGRLFIDATDMKDVRDGGWGWGTAFFDYDNDADLDLIMTNGQSFSQGGAGFYSEDVTRLWRNDGPGQMREVAEEVGLYDARPGKGLLVFDYDRDGDLDVLITHDGDAPALYRNDGGNQRAWLRVRAIGTQSVRDGFGTRAYVTVKAQGLTQMREISGGSHFLGQSETIMHFGLGEVTGPIHQVRVVWPATGTEKLLADVASNHSITVYEEGEEEPSVDHNGANGASEPGCQSTADTSPAGCAVTRGSATEPGYKGCLVSMWTVALVVTLSRRRRARHRARNIQTVSSGSTASG